MTQQPRTPTTEAAIEEAQARWAQAIHEAFCTDHEFGRADVVAAGLVRARLTLSWATDDRIERLTTALRVATHTLHDQDGEPVEGFPVCSVCGAIQVEHTLVTQQPRTPTTEAVEPLNDIQIDLLRKIVARSDEQIGREWVARLIVTLDTQRAGSAVRRVRPDAAPPSPRRVAALLLGFVVGLVAMLVVIDRLFGGSGPRRVA